MDMGRRWVRAYEASPRYNAQGHKPVLGTMGANPLAIRGGCYGGRV